MNTNKSFAHVATVPDLTSVTDKYAFIHTESVEEEVIKAGYAVERRFNPRRGLGLHGTVFTHPKLPKMPGLDVRIAFYNSHNGTAAQRFVVQIGVGLCANILEVDAPEKALAARIVHRGNALDRVTEALQRVEAYTEDVVKTIARLQSTQLSDFQALKFACDAIDLRNARPFRLESMLHVLHQGQGDNTAWNVLNRVQEALIKGGYRTIDERHPAYPGAKAREVTSIGEKAKINRALWKLMVDCIDQQSKREVYNEAL